MIQTTEYGLASYLLCKGLPITKTELNARGEVEFTFGEEARDEEQAFYQNSGLVEIQTFLGASRQVKNLIYRLKRNNYGNNKRGI